jgi:hypothetical protein
MGATGLQLPPLFLKQISLCSQGGLKLLGSSSLQLDLQVCVSSSLFWILVHLYIANRILCPPFHFFGPYASVWITYTSSTVDFFVFLAVTQFLWLGRQACTLPPEPPAHTPVIQSNWEVFILLLYRDVVGFFQTLISWVVFIKVKKPRLHWFFCAHTH